MVREEDQEEDGKSMGGREKRWRQAGSPKWHEAGEMKNFPTLHSVSLLIVTVLLPQTGFLNCIVCLP